MRPFVRILYLLFMFLTTIWIKTVGPAPAELIGKHSRKWQLRPTPRDNHVANSNVAQLLVPGIHLLRNFSRHALMSFYINVGLGLITSCDRIVDRMFNIKD